MLFEHYMTTQRTLGPIVAEMTEGDFEDWVKKLAVGGSAYPLDLLSDMKNVLLLGMAFRLHTSHGQLLCWIAARRQAAKQRPKQPSRR